MRRKTLLVGDTVQVIRLNLPKRMYQWDFGRSTFKWILTHVCRAQGKGKVIYDHGRGIFSVKVADKTITFVRNELQFTGRQRSQKNETSNE